MYDFDYIRSVDTETISWMKEKMMEAYRGAVSYLNAEDREAAHYWYGVGEAYKHILEEKYDFRPEQEIDELDDLLFRLEEEL